MKDLILNASTLAGSSVARAASSAGMAAGSPYMSSSSAASGSPFSSRRVSASRIRSDRGRAIAKAGNGTSPASFPLSSSSPSSCSSGSTAAAPNCTRVSTRSSWTSSWIRRARSIRNGNGLRRTQVPEDIHQLRVEIHRIVLVIFAPRNEPAPECCFPDDPGWRAESDDRPQCIRQRRLPAACRPERRPGARGRESELAGSCKWGTDSLTSRFGMSIPKGPVPVVLLFFFDHVNGDFSWSLRGAAAAEP